MRIIFMGTPDFAVPSLRAILASGHEVVAVYTQPPRQAGFYFSKAAKTFSATASGVSASASASFGGSDSAPKRIAFI